MKPRLPKSLLTERCWLRPFQPRDLDDLFSLYGDPAVMATRKIGVQTKDGTAEQLRAFVKLWQERGFGLYAVFQRETDTFMGECGFRPYAPDQPEVIELSYGLRPQFWGGGIATEIAAEMIDTGFVGFITGSMVAHARMQNKASHRVLTKLGFRRCDPEHLSLPDDLARFALTEDQWRSRKENML